MKNKELKIGIKANVEGFEIIKSKVQYLNILIEETEKTLNFLKDYKFNLDMEYSVIKRKERS